MAMGTSMTTGTRNSHDCTHTIATGILGRQVKYGCKLSRRWNVRETVSLTSVMVQVNTRQIKSPGYVNDYTTNLQ